MKVLVIGGSGHIGGFLSPQLHQQGHQVIVVSRGRTPIPDTPPWRNITVKTAACARDDKTWQTFIAQQRAEVVIDIPGSDVPNTYHAAKTACKHFIACGSLWMFGLPKVVPTPEQTQSPCEFEGYARRYAEMLQTKHQAQTDGIPFTAIMPPNICGPHKIPLDCAGGRSLQLHKDYAAGKPVTLPAYCNNLIGPCDAADIANAFALAVAQRDPAAYQIFNVAAAYSLTAPEFVKAYADIYQTDIPIEYVDSKTYYQKVLPEPGANFHFRAHMQGSLAKITALLGYRPQFTPEQTMARAVDWMKSQKML